ncbi:unnamed protein product [Litomosoides sigmodontis]|uniref:Major sperm protein n=1 Tax=Litomosoides sigmodontis TaxID=42156 RepID=A0A3P6S6P1_LITSI|nr:unnamed protein product [Litomosoides sigmodontis]
MLVVMDAQWICSDTTHLERRIAIARQDSAMAASESKRSLSSTTENTSPIYVTVEPKQLTFHDDPQTSSVLLRITNVSHVRVAFRIRSNVPTQYIVMPATGFLSANESINVLITNLYMRRYRRRHRFIIQTMKAKESDKDRRKIWSDSRAENFHLIQCIRLVTSVLNNRKASAQRSGQSRSENDQLDQLTISSDSETGESEAAQAEVITDGGKSVKITELNKQISTKLEEKRNEWESLMQAVSEVKKTETDLDRATVQCNDLNKMIILEKDQQKVLQLKLVF